MSPEVTVGVDPLKVKMTVPSWGAVKRWFVGPDPISALRPLTQGSHVGIMRPSEGNAEFSFTVVNLGKRAVTPFSFSVRQWTWGSTSLPDLPFVARSLNTPIRGHDLRGFTVSAQLNDAAIRLIMENSPEKPAMALRGGIQTVIYADMYFVGIERPLDLQLSFLLPRTYFYWYE
jgi:hypothetical protein